MPSSQPSLQPTVHYNHPLPSSHASVYMTPPISPPTHSSSQSSPSSTPSSMTSRQTPGSGSEGRGKRKPVPGLRPIDVGKAQRVGKGSGAVVVCGPSTASSSTSTIFNDVDTPTDQRRHRPIETSTTTNVLSPPILAALSPFRPTIKKKPPPPPPSAPSPVFASLEPTHRYPSWIEQGHRPNATRQKRETLGIQDGTVLHNILMTPSWGLSSTTVDQHPRPSTSYSNERLVSPPLPQKSRRDRNRDSLFDRAADFLTARRLRLINKQATDRPIVGGSGYCEPSPVEMGERRQVDLSDMEEYRRKYGKEEEGRSVFWRRKPEKKEKGEKKGSVMRFLFARNGGNKKREDEEKEEERIRQKRKRMIFIAITSIILVAIIIIAVCVSLLTGSKSHTASASTSNSTISTSTSSTAAPASPTGPTAYTLASCLSLFALSAPTSPLTYPCDACSPLLSSTNNDFTSGGGGNTTGVGAALQFCALRDIYISTGMGTTSTSTGTTTSTAVTPSASTLSGWLNSGTNVCSNWSGVTCDGEGRVTGLSLVYPAVPSQLASSFGNLVSLKTLKIVGNTAIPFGTIPSNLFTPTNLSSITIQSTSLTSIPTNAFSSLANLLSLALVSNAKLGSTLPSLSGNGKLLTLVVTGQSLTGDPFSSLPTSLTYLDLSYNSLSGSIPDLTRLSSLSSLFLDSNAFTALPTSFPSSLQDLSIQSNPSLGGTLPTSLCTSTLLSACNLKGTSLAASNMHNTTSTVMATRTTVSGSSTTVGTQTSVVTSVATAASCGSCVFV